MKLTDMNMLRIQPPVGRKIIQWQEEEVGIWLYIR
jgi:hypothetical protein